MDAIIDILVNYGMYGMLVSAFLAGSFFPFPSEAVMLGLLAVGADPVRLFVWGSIGNVAGSMFNYCMGRLGKVEWIHKYLHIKQEDIDKTMRFMEGKGAWMGLLAVVPLMGSAITVTLGLMRARWTIVLLSVTIGKVVRYLILLFGTSIVVNLSSCSHDKATTNGNDRQIIAVSIEPLRYVAEGICGERMEVMTIVTKGNNPETYEPTTRQMAQLEKCPLIVMAGQLGFEKAWKGRIRQNIPSTTIAEVMTVADGQDPHTWTSPRNMMNIAEKIYQEVVRIDSKDSLYFKHRKDSLIEIFKATDEYIRSKTKTLNNRAFVIFHPSLTYFAHDYNLRQIAIEQEGKEPTPESQMKTINEAKKAGVKLVMVQKEFDQRHAQNVANAMQAHIVYINPLNYDWVTEMKTIADEIYRYNR